MLHRFIDSTVSIVIKSLCKNHDKIRVSRTTERSLTQCNRAAGESGAPTGNDAMWNRLIAGAAAPRPAAGDGIPLCPPTKKPRMRRGFSIEAGVPQASSRDRLLLLDAFFRFGRFGNRRPA